MIVALRGIIILKIAVCPGGYWGLECATRCDCGQGNGCDRETGMCDCNTCWQYDDSSMNCSTSKSCFFDGPCKF